MPAEIKEIPLETLTICGFQGPNLIHLATLQLTDSSARGEVIAEILNELATKPNVIMGSTLVFTEGFDGFRVL